MFLSEVDLMFLKKQRREILPQASKIGAVLHQRMKEPEEALKVVAVKVDILKVIQLIHLMIMKIDIVRGPEDEKMILLGKRVAAENTQSITSIEVGDLLAVLVTGLEKIIEIPREKSESEKTDEEALFRKARTF